MKGLGDFAETITNLTAKNAKDAKKTWFAKKIKNRKSFLTSKKLGEILAFAGGLDPRRLCGSNDLFS